jgi:predicted nucleic acid-binding protein
MIVVDVNVVLSGLRSSLGASHIVLRAMIAGDMPFAISPAVALEYEDVLKRPGILGETSSIVSGDIDVVLDALLKQAKLVSPAFRYRPILDDPKDDLYIECALAAGATRIVSNDKHFRHPALASFGISACLAADIVSDLRRRNQI